MGEASARPSEIFRQHFLVAPYPEENVRRVVDEVGIEPIVFGSDFPHGEGLAWPSKYANSQLKDFDESEKKRIMRATRHLPSAPGLTPPFGKRRGSPGNSSSTRTIGTSPVSEGSITMADPERRRVRIPASASARAASSRWATPSPRRWHRARGWSAPRELGAPVTGQTVEREGAVRCDQTHDGLAGGGGWMPEAFGEAEQGPERLSPPDRVRHHGPHERVCLHVDDRLSAVGRKGRTDPRILVNREVRPFEEEAAGGAGVRETKPSTGRTPRATPPAANVSRVASRSATWNA